jgi:hypothetical protein
MKLLNIKFEIKARHTPQQNQMDAKNVASQYVNIKIMTKNARRMAAHASDKATKLENVVVNTNNEESSKELVFCNNL